MKRLSEIFFELRWWLATQIVFGIFRLLRATWRLEEDPYPPGIQERLDSGRPVVFAHWHEDEWSLLGFYLGRGMNVLVSLSKDGSLMARFLKKFGFNIARGSSSRGAVGGLLNLIRAVEESSEKAVCLAIDGPRGPRRRSKNGIFKLAQSLKAPVVGGTVYASSAWVFKKSWSRAFIPKPFAKVRLAYSAVIDESKILLGVERDDYATLCYELEENLKAAKGSSQQSVGTFPPKV